MNARLSERSESQNGQAASAAPSHDADSTLTSSPSVLSVSARSAGPAENTMPANGTSGAAKTIYLTPRVIDQEAFDDLAGALRQLITDAEEYRAILAAQIDGAAQGVEQSAKQNASLQERLRLSARMLKAFQSQIVRIETAVAAFDEQHQQAADAQRIAEQARERLNAHCNDAVEQTRQRLDEIVKQATDELEEAVAHRLVRLAEFDQRLEQCARRAADLEGVVDAAERNIGALAYRHAELCERFDGGRRELEGVLQQCDQVRGTLSEQLLNATEKVGAISDQCDQIGSVTEAHCETIAALQGATQQTVEEAQTIRERLTQAEEMRRGLTDMLDRLQQWEPLLQYSLDADDAPLPEPLAKIIDTARTRVDRKLTSFSTALREMAAEIERDTTESRDGEN